MVAVVGLLDVPNEILQKNVLAYCAKKEMYSLSQVCTKLRDLVHDRALKHIKAWTDVNPDLGKQFVQKRSEQNVLLTEEIEIAYGYKPYGQEWEGQLELRKSRFIDQDWSKFGLTGNEPGISGEVMVANSDKICFYRRNENRVYLFIHDRFGENCTVRVFDEVHGFHLYMRNNLLVVLCERSADNFHFSAFSIEVMDTDNNRWHKVDYVQHVPSDFSAARQSVVSDLQLTGSYLAIHLLKLESEELDDEEDVDCVTMLLSLQDILQSSSDASVQVYRNPPAFGAEMDFGSIVNTMDTGIFAVNDVYIVILYEHLLSSDIFLRIMKKDQKCSKFEPHRDVWVNTEGTGRVLLDLENTPPQEIFLNDGNSNQLIYVDNHTLYLISLNVGTFTRKFDIAGAFCLGNWFCGVFHVLSFPVKVESNEDTSAVNAPTGPTAGNALTDQPDGNALTGQPDGKALTGQPDGNALNGQPDVNALTGQPAGNAHILLIDPSNTDYGKVPGRTLAVDHKVVSDTIHVDYLGLVMEVEWHGKRVVMQIPA